jgi:hypothetical protein
VSEQDTRWGLVVESDEIYSAKTNRWYEVVRSVASLDGTTIGIFIKGQPKPIRKPVGDPVRVRRGATGRAVDMFAVIFSGQTRPEAVGMDQASTMATDRVEDE